MEHFKVGMYIFIYTYIDMYIIIDEKDDRIPTTFSARFNVYSFSSPEKRIRPSQYVIKIVMSSTAKMKTTLFLQLICLSVPLVVFTLSPILNCRGGSRWQTSA